VCVCVTRVLVAPGNEASEHVKEVVDVLLPGLRDHGQQGDEDQDPGDQDHHVGVRLSISTSVL